MARRLVVQPQSDLDIQATTVWYEDQRFGLGSRFLDELDLVFQRIEGNPRQFPRVQGDVHRALFRHFPYGVYFLVESEDIKVLAVLHLHREPDM
jgi:toxin ParE1/3/4